MTDLHKTQPEASLPIKELSALMRQQAEAIKSLKTQLFEQLKKEIEISTKQLEACQGLEALVGDLPPPVSGKLSPL